VPTIVNLTNGDLVTYAGLLRCGDELVLGLEGERLTARQRGRDVSDRLLTTRDFAPGTPFGRDRADAAPRPLRLRPGLNDLWFVCLGIYDAPGYDGAEFQPPLTDLVQGVFAGSDPAVGSRFDRSLFHQAPAAIADLWWEQAEPARFRVDLPTVAVLREESSPGAEAELDRLVALLDAMVGRLRAAGVDGRVQRLRFGEIALTHDSVAAPVPEHEERMAADGALEALGAMFDVTAKDGARYE
jgi:hypothetical protein